MTPMPCSTSASGAMDTPPMPTRWARQPGFSRLFNSVMIMENGLL